MSSVLTLVPTAIVCSVVEGIMHSGLLRAINLGGYSNANYL